MTTNAPLNSSAAEEEKLKQCREYNEKLQEFITRPHRWILMLTIVLVGIMVRCVRSMVII